MRSICVDCMEHAHAIQRERTTHANAVIAFLTLAWLPGPLQGAVEPSAQPPVQRQREQAPTSGTVPIDLRDNRIFVQLTCVRPDGSLRQARFQVDSGGGSVILSESLSHDLALRSIGSPSEEDGETFQLVTSPEIRIGEMPLNLSDVSTVVATGSKGDFSPGSGAEGFFPAPLLRKYEVVFDYPARRFTLAQPGALTPRGVPVPSPIGANSGFPRIELTVDGEKYGFLLDTGAAYTMISKTLIDKWKATHPDWPRCVGAAGAANMIGGAFDAKAEMLRLAEMRWDTFHLPRVGVVSRPPGTFEKQMSEMMTAPIVGAIGGNVLRAFRVEIDYQHGMTYLEKGNDVESDGQNTVGVVIGAHPDGSYTISGVAQCRGKNLVEGVQSGDKIIGINDWAVTGSLADVLHELQGTPGEVKNMLRSTRWKKNHYPSDCHFSLVEEPVPRNSGTNYCFLAFFGGSWAGVGDFVSPGISFGESASLRITSVGTAASNTARFVCCRTCRLSKKALTSASVPGDPTEASAL